MNVNEIYEVLEELKPGENFRSSSNYVVDRLLESMDIIDLVSMLESKYNFQFDVTDLVPETFIDAESLFRVIQKYKSAL